MGEKTIKILNTTKIKRKEKKIERICAFFDLDGTLTFKDTGKGFFVFLILKRKLSLMKALYVATIVFRYLFKNLDYYIAMNKIYSITKGMKVKEINDLAKDYYDAKGKNIFRKDVFDILKNHKENSTKIVIATNSWDVSAKHFAKNFRADALIATKIEEKKGYFTGEVKTHCFGDFKKDIIVAFAKENNIDLEKSFAYSDSNKDIPMLKAVGTPVVTYPNKRMRKIANKNGYNVIG